MVQFSDDSPHVERVEGRMGKAMSAPAPPRRKSTAVVQSTETGRSRATTDALAYARRKSKRATSKSAHCQRRATGFFSQSLGAAYLASGASTSVANISSGLSGKVSKKGFCSALPCYLWPFLILIDTIGPFSTDAYLPNLVEIERQFKTSTAVASLSFQLNLMASAVSCLIMGALADRFGRKRVLQSCFVVYTVAAAWAALSSSIFELIVARTLMGLGQGSSVLAQVITRDLVEDTQLRLQVMSTLASLVPIAIVTASPVGGAIGGTLGWRWVFWFQTSVGVLMVLGATVMRESRAPLEEPELGDESNQSGLARVAGRLLCSRLYVGSVGLFGLMFAAVSAMLTLIPFLMQQYYGMSTAGTGAVMGVVPMFIMGGASLSMVLSKCLAPINVLRVVMLPPFLIVLVFAGSMWLFWRSLPNIGIPADAWWPHLLPCVLMVVVNGIFIPICQTLYLEPFQDMAGAAAGAAGLTQNVMMTVGSAVASGIWNGTPGSFHLALGAWMLAAQVWFWSTLGLCPPAELSTDGEEMTSDDESAADSEDEMSGIE